MCASKNTHTHKPDERNHTQVTDRYGLTRGNTVYNGMSLGKHLNGYYELYLQPVCTGTSAINMMGTLDLKLGQIIQLKFENAAGAEKRTL